jgi:integrase
MPLKLVPPRKGRSPNFTIRGSYLGVAVDRTSGTPRRSVAQRRLKDIEAKIEAGEYEREPAPSPDVKTFAAAALAYLKAGHARRYVKRLALRFADTPIEAIGQAELDAAALAICPNTSPATRNRTVYTPTLAILHAAGATPRVKRPAGAKGEVRADHLNPADAAALIAAADALDEEFGILLRFLLYTGCRVGEALALTWDRVDLDRGTAFIRKTKARTPRATLLRADLTERLSAHRAACIEARGPSGRVFRWRGGGWPREMMLAARLKACGLKLPPRSVKRHVPWHRLSWVTFHVLRHTFATWMRRYGGLDLQGLIATDNWSDLKSVARYAHVEPRAEWERVETLPSVGGKSVESA